MPLFDSHCHLDAPEFDADRTSLLSECRLRGIAGFMVPAIGADNWQRVMALSVREPDIWFALGIHPCFVAQQPPDVMARLTALVQQRPSGLVAIGECGLDGRSHLPQAGQQELFEAQIRLAMTLDLPLIVHSVRANDTVLKLLRRHRPGRGGVIHAFSGSQHQAERFWELGFRLGIGGTITYERANKTREAVAAMPLESLLLETDSPDMPLCGHQGMRNTPLSLLRVLDELAIIKRLPASHVAAVLYESTQDIFHLGK